MSFSVLMSMYKNDNPMFLKIALESIYDRQTLKPDEIVLVWDGPVGDDLAKTAEDFAAGRPGVVKLLKQPVNKGLGEALRVGSEACSNELIMRMDSDDVSDPLRFEKQAAYMEAHPEIDVLGTDIAEFNETPDETDMKIRACPEKHEDIVERCKSRNPMNHVTVCIRKSALVKCGGYESLLYLEDYYLWAKMIVAGCRLANIHETLVYVRVGNGFIGRRGSKERIKGWKIMQDYMIKNGLIGKMKALVNMVTIRAFIYTPSGVKKFLYSKILRK